jgi:hypothetical protein
MVRERGRKYLEEKNRNEAERQHKKFSAEISRLHNDARPQIEKVRELEHEIMEYKEIRAMGTGDRYADLVEEGFSALIREKEDEMKRIWDKPEAPQVIHAPAGFIGFLKNVFYKGK